MDTHMNRSVSFVLETRGKFLLTVSVFSVKSEGWSSSENEGGKGSWGLQLEEHVE